MLMDVTDMGDSNFRRKQFQRNMLKQVTLWDIGNSEGNLCHWPYGGDKVSPQSPFED